LFLSQKLHSILNEYVFNVMYYHEFNLPKINIHKKICSCENTVTERNRSNSNNILEYAYNGDKWQKVWLQYIKYYHYLVSVQMERAERAWMLRQTDISFFCFIQYIYSS
jgi:hypothetical protein